jgi:hypothetical protein
MSRKEAMTLTSQYWMADKSRSGPWLSRIGVYGFLFLAVACAVGQGAKPPEETIKDGYVIHQTATLGGHIVDYSGSGQMWATLVNLQSGPRVLGQTFEMHSVEGAKHSVFDTLLASISGFGGDPLNVASLRVSKGKVFDFRGLFRRDRQYFDYNLLNNPLVPAGLVSNGYTFPQVTYSPVLFNTVRRMTDVNLTILPISKVSFRAGYSQNIQQGPTFSSVHYGVEALLQQNWRNSTDNWVGAVDWKPFSKTLVTFEEHVTHYKGNTTWQLAPLPPVTLQLSNGSPATLGFDNVSLPSCTGAPISSSTTAPATANATCNGYLQYNRYAPTRSIFPTEEFRFNSSYVKNIQMNGRVRYTGANMNLPNYYEYFNGLQTRGSLRASTVTGYSTAQRVNVSADYGVVWQVSEKISLSDQYDFWYFRQPAFNYLSEIDQAGTSMLVAPGTPNAPSVTTTNAFLGQKTHMNLAMAAWQISPRASISLGYRYRSKAINRSLTGESYAVNIHENGGILGVALRPTSQWRINGSVEAMYANRTYVQLAPRALQHYQIHASYKPKEWATLSGTFNDLETRNNVQYINHLAHNRSYSLSASLMPNVHYGIEASYSYLDVFSQTGICFALSPAPPGTVPVPPGTGCGSNIYLGKGYYDAPTQYGSIGITVAPTKAIRTGLGYRMSSVSGTTELLNPRQVAGSLQSQFQVPYANVAWTIHPTWIWSADWNYYGYGEASATGPTSPRPVHGNVYTIAMHYEF